MSELALLALVMVEAAGFGRVFQGTSWQGPVLATPVAVMSAMALCRRFRLHWAYWAVLAAAVTWVVPAELALRPYLQLGLPVQEAFSAAGRLSATAADQFHATATPAPPLPGFVLWAAWAMGAAMAAAYLVAYAAESAGAALAPLVVFAVCCALSGGSGRYAASAATVATTVLFLSAHPGPGMWPQRGPGEWLHRRPVMWRGRRTAPVPPPARRPATPTGRPVSAQRLFFTVTPTLVALSAVAACLGVTPVLGQEGRAPAGWHRLPATQQRLSPNPLVSMRAELYAGSRLPAFVVSSTLPTYWRLTTLDYFDGTNWESAGLYSDATALPAPSSRQLAGDRTVRERFHIQDLSSTWLPVGFQPRRVWGLPGVSYSPSSSTLLVSSGTAEGTNYQVLASENTALTDAAGLDREPPLTTWDRSQMNTYLQIPPDVPSNVSKLAGRLTTAKTTEYEKALALQSFFHRPPFAYTLAPPPYPDGNDLSGFLFATHAGYCQQYASAFAVLGRLAGLPTRVAVGFTTGTRIGHGEWEVTGADAHAWPEVWFPRAGWVPFEPTPSFSYTGGTTGARRATGGPRRADGNPGARDSGSGRGGGTSVSSSPHKHARRNPSRFAEGPGNHNAGSSSASKRHTGPTGPSVGYKIAFGALGAGALAVVIVSCLCLAAQCRRRRPHQPPGRPARGAQDAAASERALVYRELLAIWQRTERRFSRLGLPIQPGETPAEWCERAGQMVARMLGTPQDPYLARLVTALYAAAFGGALPQSSAIAEIERDCNAAWRDCKKHARQGVARRARTARGGASGDPAQATG